METSATILVIEDNDNLRLLLCAILERDFKAIPKRDSLEALAWLTLGNIPDIILLDINMPHLSGFELMAHLRRNSFFHRIPIFVLSGESSQDVIHQCYELGAKGYFTKPFKPDELTHSLKNAVQTALA